MTVKNAIEGLNFLIENKTKVKNEILDPNMMWNKGEPSISKFTEALSSLLQRDISSLQKIKNEIEPKCKHPKKMQDICDGQRYCMNCNLDL